MPEEKKRPVSPINGVPLPEGRPFVQGEEQRELARKAGKKSGEARAARKTLREELLILLQEELTDKQGRTVPTQRAISTAVIKSALAGSIRAYEVIRDTIGEKPAENVNLVTSDFSALEEAFNAVKPEDSKE